MITFLLLGVLSLGAPSDEFKVEGNNITEDYLTIWSDVKNSDPFSMGELKNCKILIIPGFLSDHFSKLQKIPGVRRLPMAQHFVEYKNLFSANKIPYEVVDIHSESSPSYNAKIIHTAISRADRPVILLSHSKGGLDALTALVEFPGLQEKVKGFLALNTPFAGTPLADDSLRFKPIRWMIDKALEWLGGDLDAVESMKIQERADYLAHRYYNIKKMQDKVRTLSFATHIKNRRGWDTNFEIPRNYMEKQGYLNDGMVPWQSQILPTSDYIVMGGMDHVSSVAKSSSHVFDKARFLKTMFRLLQQERPINRRWVQSSLGQTFTR